MLQATPIHHRSWFDKLTTNGDLIIFIFTHAIASAAKQSHRPLYNHEHAEIASSSAMGGLLAMTNRPTPVAPPPPDVLQSLGYKAIIGMRCQT